MDPDASNAWESFTFAFVPPTTITAAAPEVKKRARREVVEDDSEPLSLSTDMPPSPAYAPSDRFQDLAPHPPQNLEKRLHELQGQLIVANDRAHTMEVFIQQQETWLEQEREEHAATDRRLQNVETELYEERMRNQIQTSVMTALEAEVEEATRRLAQVMEDSARQVAQANGACLELKAYIAKIELEDTAAQVKEEAAQEMERFRQTLEDAHQEEIVQLVQTHIAESAATQAERDALHDELGERVRKLHADGEMSAQRVHELEQLGEGASLRIHQLERQLGKAAVELDQSRQETHEACCEASRLGEALAEKRQKMSLGRKMREALQTIFTIACQLGDRQADSAVLTDNIDYASWRKSLSALSTTGSETMDDIDPSLIHGAATVIGTLVPILYSLFVDVGKSNEKLISEYDRVAERCKELEAELVKCECPKLKAYIAQIEKEMRDAEQLIHQQNGVNKDLHIRVSHRNSLDQVKIDGANLLQNMVMAQEQKRQLQVQVASLERTLASVRSTSEKLQSEKGELEAKLLEAEKQIPPPRALIHIGTLSDNVEELRRSLGPLVEDVDCAQCVLYLGKAREADRKCALAEQSVVEEQRRLVLLTQENKRAFEGKMRELEAISNEKAAEEKKKTAKAERRLAEAEAKLREGGKQTDVHRTELAAKDKEMQDHLVICQRKLAAKNTQIEELQGAATQVRDMPRSLIPLLLTPTWTVQTGEERTLSHESSLGHASVLLCAQR
jgi:golgin subfamily B member 1